MAEEFIPLEQALGKPNQEDDFVPLDKVLAQEQEDFVPLKDAILPQDQTDYGHPMVKAVADWIDEYEQSSKGSLEAAANVATASAGSMIAGLYTPIQAAISALQGKDLGDTAHDVEKRFNQIATALTYDPVTDKGKTYSEYVMKPFELLSEGGQILGEKTFEATGSPELSTAVRIGPETAAYAILPGLLKARAKVKAKAAEASAGKPTTTEVKIPEGAYVAEEIVMQGDAPLPGAPYRASTMSPGTLKPLIGDTVKATPEQLYEYTKDVLNGDKEPTIVVEADGGKVTRIVEGEIAAHVYTALGEKKIPVRVIERTRSDVPKEVVDKEASKVGGYYDKLDEAVANQSKNYFKRFFSGFKEGVVDVAYDVRSRLIDARNPVAKTAAISLDNINGAPARAQEIFIQAEKNIYNGMHKKQRQMLDRVIASRRIIEIDKYKGTGTVKHGDNLTGREHESYMKKLREEIGDKNFVELNRRADAYFEATNSAFTKLFEHGLIDEKLFTKLKDIDYSMTSYLDIIDPVRTYNIGGRKVTVHDSGIEKFKGGAPERIMNTDSRELLAQTIGRTESRIAKNEATRRLADYAKDSPNNGWVSTGKGSKKKLGGKAATVEYQREGKTKKVYMDPTMAEQWVAANPMMSYDFANLARIVSGSSVVRAAATGYNPAFALVNMPRDLAHIWLATGEYSNMPVITAVQMARDMAAVSVDALLHKGRYKDYIEQGGGMNFLSHQGRELFATDKFATHLEPKMNKIKKAFGYINETSEIWTRLALRERALRNIKKRGGSSVLDAPTEATWVARSYLDFSRGGKYSKGADNAIPYLNAANQAFRGVAREVKTHPGRFAAKVGWLLTVDLSLMLANQLTNPEAWAQVPDETRRDYWVITTPFYEVDENGYKRYMYFRFKRDDTIVGLTALSQSLGARYFEDRVPNANMTDAIGHSIPYFHATIPTMEAWYTYASNRDFWNDRKIWGSDPGTIEPGQEYYTGEEVAGNKERTHVMYRMIGELTNMSPERMRAATDKVLPRNDWIDLVGGGFKTIFDEMPPAVKDRTGMELLAQGFFVRSAISLTHPAATDFERLEGPARQARTEQEMIVRQLDTLYTRNREGKGGSLAEVERMIRDAPVSMRDSLQKRFLRHKKLDMVMKTFAKGPEDMSRGMWLNLQNQTPLVRAKLFYEEWKVRSPEGKRKLERQAMALTRAGGGFMSDKFRAEFIRLQKHYGK